MQDNDVSMQQNQFDSQATVDLQSDGDEDAYSDFADDPETLEILDQLLQAATQKQEVDAPLEITDIEDYEGPRGVRLPKVFGVETTRRWQHQTQPVQTQAPQNIREQSGKLYDLRNILSCWQADQRLAERNRRKSNEEEVKVEKEETPRPEKTQQDAALQPTGPDTRSLLDRFRKPPKKALSVTDLISPSWCELQYYYVLTKHGRKRRTPAMKQGTAAHQALEDEVHTTVPVEITKKEDSWGLRIWNIIQGLRTLRDTGRTRELEIWGSIGGELVNGVIDELSYECPDPKLEELSQTLLEKQDVEPPLPEYQASIKDYLVTSEVRDQSQSLSQALARNDDREAGNESTSSQTRRPKKLDERKIYITDVKTRQSPTLPTGSAIRPTLVQLHLYHHILENLAQGKFSLSQLAERHKFDINETFSDTFIAQVGGLNQEVFALSQQTDDMMNDLPSSTQDSMDILLQHNNLANLWDFMLEQMRITFLLPSDSSSTSTSSNTGAVNLQDPTLPPPSSLSTLPTPHTNPTRLSPILTARYIATNYNHLSSQSRILGTKSLLFNPSFLTSQLYASLSFWKGEREPKGVEVNDAWKCRVCEFRDECVWVKERDENMVREAKERRRVKGELEDAKEDGSRRSRVWWGKDEAERCCFLALFLPVGGAGAGASMQIAVCAGFSYIAMRIPAGRRQRPFCIIHAVLPTLSDLDRLAVNKQNWVEMPYPTGWHSIYTLLYFLPHQGYVLFSSSSSNFNPRATCSWCFPSKYSSKTSSYFSFPL